jgi:TonB family protein
LGAIGVVQADMKTLYRFLFILGFLASFGGLFAVSPFEPPGDNDGVTINQTDALIYPFSMTTSGILSGEARVVLSVNDDGKLTDTLAVGYTNATFADAAIAALKRWTYEPARVHGIPRASRAYVLFTFKNDMGVMIQKLPGMADASAVRSFRDDRYVFKACQLSQLDRIPIPAQVVPPNLPKGVLSAKRSVTVEFYIDDQGRVRMPAVDRSEADDNYAAAAVRAVEQWRFEPPLRKGLPVLVLARQEFNFVPKH